jgi:hypothetical protein
MNSTALSTVFLREALAGWIVTLEKLIDPATSLPLTYCLLTLSYLAPDIASPLNEEVIVKLPLAFSLSNISILNWIFPDLSIDTLENVKVEVHAEYAASHLSFEV